MRIKLVHGHVMFDVDNSEVRLLVDGANRAVKSQAKRTSPERHACASALPGLAVAAVEAEPSFVKELNQRANKQTRVLEEILSHYPPRTCWGINE